ncbi:Protein of unknown function [Bacillus cereus]|uniref:PadR family transcriptional regulator n=1 Tax=Bacillus wiedmannii TaxID=1890302 RepID=A0AB37YZ64_9BACI|nr:Protein of unknown function [Bacillus wiedmannii]SCC66226.1 Protein of unknown function [Bacillus cereus]SCN09567.1 Protein of unknown function [Bacillus wiedmannii]SCN40226.1 Protein of unknown function [Bacillus wiedmannii]
MYCVYKLVDEIIATYGRIMPK